MTRFSGLRYAFNPSNKPGLRITKTEVLAKDGTWRPLDKKAAYQVVTVDFLARGGDGFTMLAPLRWQEDDKLANDVLRVYLERNSPIAAELEGRITARQ